MASRTHLAAMARETLEILQEGGYHGPGGRRVELRDDLDRAVRGTRLYRPTDFPGAPAPPADYARPGSTIETTDETTLAAAARLLRACGEPPLCLNFASARNPGGGFLAGARAQEESLARSSGLYACLLQAPDYYDHHRSVRTAFYSDHMIYSPGVPVFRDDAGGLLEEPYRVAFLTSPAVNANVVRDREPGRMGEIAGVMRGRIARVLWAALREGHSHLVLGAWGCGAFGNDPGSLAALFAEALGPGGPYHGVFRHVVFAVFDPVRDQPNLLAFRERIPESADGCQAARRAEGERP